MKESNVCCRSKMVIILDLFDSLYEEHYKKLYTLAFRMTGKKEDAEDVLQNAFINAYKSYESFRQDSSFSTWIYRIVINEAKKHILYIKTMPVDEYAHEIGISSNDVYSYINSFDDTEEQVISEAVRETCLQLFMNCMPPKYRIVFTLRVIIKLSTKDTAEILEISENAVKVNLYRARALIKSLMDGRCSLINPKNPCRCRAWVKYAIETKHSFLRKDIELIKQVEKQTSNQYKAEMKEIASVMLLYNTHVIGKQYEAFKEQIKLMIKQRRLKILEVN